MQSPFLHSLVTVPRLVAPMLALCLLPAACVEEGLEDEELVAQEGDEALADDESSRLFCLYGNTPPSTNDSDTLIGANDEVESSDEADGDCDLHMFRVTADPPSDRARTIDFFAISMAPIDDYGGRVWTKSCAGNLCATDWSASVVSFSVSGGGVVCPTIHDCIPIPYVLEGQINLSATNSIVDIRAGMRASDDDGDPIPVTITVSE